MFIYNSLSERCPWIPRSDSNNSKIILVFQRTLRDSKAFGTQWGGKSKSIIDHKPFLNFLQNDIDLFL